MLDISKQGHDRALSGMINQKVSLCPSNYVMKDNFYLQSLQKLTPKQWYAGQVVGTHTLSKVERYFANHSARCTGGTRLFQVGVDCKLVKESSGDTSDTVNKFISVNKP